MLISHQTQNDLGKLLLRLLVGGLILLHGIAKLGNAGALAFIESRLSASGLPPVLVYGVFVGEVLAPVLLILGYRARLAALLIAINMLFAVGLVHMGELLELNRHGGWKLELQAFFFWGALAITLLGSGRFALRQD